MKRTLADLTASCDGVLHGTDRAFTGVSTDTRTLAAGEVFFALRGPRYNALEFVAAAQAAGAVAAVVDAKQDVPIAQIVVPDVQWALTVSAAEWRSRFSIPLIGVAGSNGKTTAKEMTAAILAQSGECLSTRGNLNNHIGVPLTLFRIDDSHRYAVIEMGANRAGEVAALVSLGKPTIGLITNAGAEHLEGFGSLEGVAQAEGEMVAGLERDAIAVINADDAFASLWRSMTSAQVRTFGLSGNADFRAENVRTDVSREGFVTRFLLRSPLGSAEIAQRIAGRHNVSNALAAAAAATAAGATLDQVVAGLGAMNAVKGRLNFKITRAGAWLIDDSYNANPSSMQAGIDVLADLAGQKWLVIGDMGELGEFAEASHIEIGRYAKERGIERLFATGRLSALAVEAFGNGASWYPDTDSLARALDEVLVADIRLLVKGSRSNRLERVVDALVGPSGERNAG